MRQRIQAGAFAISLLLAGAAQAAPVVTLRPREAAGADVFVHEFAVPGAFGIATAARVTNLDRATLNARVPLPAVPFGNVLGSSSTTPRIGAAGETRTHATRTPSAASRWRPAASPRRRSDSSPSKACRPSTIRRSPGP